MPQSLLPCPSCHRHSCAGEPSCPFCGQMLAADDSFQTSNLGSRASKYPGRLPDTFRGPARLGRAALLAAGTFTVASCSAQPVYGAPGSWIEPETGAGGSTTVQGTGGVPTGGTDAVGGAGGLSEAGGQGGDDSTD